jgi:glycosyltransferase involved in cell wall biosynthesis
MRPEQPDVALISPYPRRGTRHDGASGVASYAANLAHSLAGAGLRPLVVAPVEPGEPDACSDGPVLVHRAFTSGRSGSLRHAIAAARASGAPVVHLQHELFLYGGPAATLGLFGALARRAAVPTVVTMHQVVDPASVSSTFTALHRVGVPAPVARAGFATLQRALPRVADAVVVHERAFGALVPGARVVPHGIEAAAAGSRAAARDALRLPAEKFVVLCFGFLAPYKGLELALDAAALAGREVHLVVAGGEHPRLAAQRDDYAGRLQSRYGGLARFTGFVPGAEVAPWFRAADLALFPYPAPHAASGALALALAHGTPSLLSPRLAATCGAPDVLQCAAEPAALAAQLRTLAGDPAHLDTVRTATAALAADRSWPAVADAHARIYQEVARADSPARRRLRAA